MLIILSVLLQKVFLAFWSAFFFATYLHNDAPQTALLRFPTDSAMIFILGYCRNNTQLVWGYAGFYNE